MPGAAADAEPVAASRYRMSAVSAWYIVVTNSNAEDRLAREILCDSASTGAPAATVRHCVQQKAIKKASKHDEKIIQECEKNNNFKKPSQLLH